MSMKDKVLDRFAQEVRMRVGSDASLRREHDLNCEQAKTIVTLRDDISVARKELDAVRAVRDRLSREADANRPKLFRLYEDAAKLVRLAERLPGLPPDRKTRSDYRIAVAAAVIELNKALHDAHDACGMIPF